MAKKLHTILNFQYLKGPKIKLLPALFVVLPMFLQVVVIKSNDVWCSLESIYTLKIYCY